MNRTIEQLCDDILERLAMMPGPEPKVDCLTDEVEKISERRDCVPSL